MVESAGAEGRKIPENVFGEYQSSPLMARFLSLVSGHFRPPCSLARSVGLVFSQNIKLSRYKMRGLEKFSEWTTAHIISPNMTPVLPIGFGIGKVSKWW